MLPFVLQPAEELSVLCLGAHCDDIEIGCGGTILKLLGSRKHSRLHWTVFCSNPERKKSALQSAHAFLAGAPAQIEVMDFRDGFLPDQWREAKEQFELLKSRVQPDVIFTPFRRDLHQDHRTISDLTWNTFRNHNILEYEIVKFDGDLGAPNFFVPLDETLLKRKTQLIIENFRTEAERTWFSEETFRALAKIRGIECNAPAGYAEAFYCRKMSFAF